MWRGWHFSTLHYGAVKTKHERKIHEHVEDAFGESEVVESDCQIPPDPAIYAQRLPHWPFNRDDQDDSLGNAAADSDNDENGEKVVRWYFDIRVR